LLPTIPQSGSLLQFEISANQATLLRTIKQVPAAAVL
jgi:hypothetical protein